MSEGRPAGLATLETLGTAVERFSSVRRKPLLLMYYPDAYGQMDVGDVKDLYDEFRDNGISKERRLPSLDVIIHTFGGNPNAAYLLAQVVRSMSHKVSILVPEYSYSGGTLFSMCGDEVLFADNARLSPIDITLSAVESDEHFELANVDYYMRFTRDCLDMVLDVISKKYESGEFRPQTRVESDLLVEMVKQVTAHDVGKFFRERTLTGFYAERLLMDYMLRTINNRNTLKDKIIRTILFELPSHEFDMDFAICSQMGLPVKQMTIRESDSSKSIVEQLNQLTLQGLICPDEENNVKVPYFKLHVSRNRTTRRHN